MTVVVSCYNQREELEFVLTGLARQSSLPLEVVLADDGSRDGTEDAVERWRQWLPVPLHHVHQEDCGFGKPRIANRAVLRAAGDYIGFLDGDTVPHGHWVRDHLVDARPGRVLCGRRTRLGPRLTAALTPAMVAAGDLERPFGPVWKSSRDGDTRNFARGIRLPRAFARFLRLRYKRLMGCNFSLPKAAFEAVNGYEEGFDEFGGEDNDLRYRLANAGYRLVPLLNRGCVFHLHHPQKPMHDAMRELASVSRTQTRAVTGLDQHESDPA